MLNNMPTGETLFSTNPNINNYFEIVYIKIDATGLNPFYQNNPLLPYKIDRRVNNPLGK